MNEQLLERKRAIKSRIDALQHQLQPHLRAAQTLQQKIDALEDEHRDVLDQIHEWGTKR
jgi:cell division septum initiation protein DivIVA